MTASVPASLISKFDRLCQGFPPQSELPRPADLARHRQYRRRQPAGVR
jgi:hypothetical protein